jgi:transcriptional regulator of arginine metabolism
MNDWRAHLPDLIARGSYRTQQDVVAALAQQVGHTIDQSTVSRELRNLGVRKEAGVYQLPPPPDLGAPVHDLRVTAAGCLAVVKTDPAFASVLAKAIDAAEVKGVVGTISGDDTVFVALDGVEALPAIERLLGRRTRR